MAFPILGALRLLAVRSGFASVVFRELAARIVKAVLRSRDSERARIAEEARTIVKRLIGSIRIDVQSGPALRMLNDLQRRKIPTATAIALTRTAKELQRILEREVDQVFDRPVAFTKRAFAIKPATRSNLQAEVFIKRKQAQYLLPQIAGGRRTPKRFEERFSSETSAPGSFWVAGQGTRLNASGNISLATVKRIATKLKKERRDIFFGQPSPSLPFGLWERTGKRAGAGLKPILIQIQAPTYRKRLDLRAIANRHAQRIFNREFARAWREIMR